jgi:hypothetical protein
MANALMLLACCLAPPFAILFNELLWKVSDVSKCEESVKPKLISRSLPQIKQPSMHHAYLDDMVCQAQQSFYRCSRNQYARPIIDEYGSEIQHHSHLALATQPA